jgi:hypothetical protein
VIKTVFIIDPEEEPFLKLVQEHLPGAFSSIGAQEGVSY